MNKKHFVFGFDTKLSKQELASIRQEEEGKLKSFDSQFTEQSISQLEQEDFLTHVEGRIVVKVDMEAKNSHTFESGLTIRRERKFNEFNRRITEPVNVIVISGEGVPKNAELLIEHNALHETNRINDYRNSFETDGSDRIRYYSIETYDCYAWRMGTGEWTPIPPFEFSLRVFKPYQGSLVGIEPEKLKDTLYCTSGKLNGEVVKTLKGCDYEIIYQSESGREGHLICFRPFGNEKRKLEEEAVAILHDKTEQVNNGELLIGYSTSDCKPFKELTNA